MAYNKVFNFRLLVLTLFYLCNQSTRAQEIDSISLAKTKTADSIKAIPLSIIVIQPNGNYFSLDSTMKVIEFKNFFGLSTLNNYGSPTNMVREQNRRSILFNHGFNCLDFTQQEIEEVNFYKANKTYSELMISQAAFFANSQSSLIDNLNAGAFLSKNFANNIDLNVSYDRINQKGIYLQSRNLIGNLNASVRFQSNASRWAYSISYFNQLGIIQHSNGISSDSVLDNPSFRIRESIPVNSNFAQTRIKGNQYLGKLSYRLKKDSSFLNPKLELSIGYKTYFNVMNDPSFRSPNASYGLPSDYDSVAIDRAYFQYTFPLGLNLQLLKSDKLNLSFQAQNERIRLIQDSSYRFDINSASFSGIATYKYLRNEFNFTGSRTTQNNYNGSQLLLNYNSSYFNNFKISLELSIVKEIPGWMQRLLFVNKSLIWNNKLSGIDQKGIALDLQSKTFAVPRVKLQFSSLQNLIYLDSNFVLQQEADKLHYLKFEISEDLYWRKIGIFNQFKFVQLSPDVAGWTAWYSQHELYLKSGLLKRSIPTRLSASVEFADPNFINGFNPLIGMFYPLTKQQKVLGPFVGFHFKAQISDLEVFLDFEHLDSFWNAQRPSQIIGYPIYDFSFNLRMQWKFFN